MDQPTPHTVQSLASDLRTLGLASGDVLLLHSSNRSLGFVAGGTQAVVQALLDVLGPEGTLVVPTHTPENTDPAGWQHPPVPEAWWPVIREQAPGFERSCTPSRWMGVIAETVRTWSGALRSDHPQVSFAALGMNAADIVSGHQLDDALGESSPLGSVYRLNGKVLLLGCGYSSNTSLHLAEWRQVSPPRAVTGSSVRQPDGTSQWATWVDVVTDESDFDRLGADFEATGTAVISHVGGATARLMSQPVLVDFATAWMAANRLPGDSASNEPLGNDDAAVAMLTADQAALGPPAGYSPSVSAVWPMAGRRGSCHDDRHGAGELRDHAARARARGAT